MKILRPDGVEVYLGSLQGQVYSMEDKEGWQYHWSIPEATRRAHLRGEPVTVSLSEMGITCDRIRSQYQGLNEIHALTRDLRLPLLFVPFGHQHQLIDGWHRLFRAAKTGVDLLPAWCLSQEDADASLILKLPPHSCSHELGQGLDW